MSEPNQKSDGHSREPFSVAQYTQRLCDGGAIKRLGLQPLVAKVMLVLIGRCDWDTGQVATSVQAIADRVGAKNQYRVREALAWLEAAGYVLTLVQGDRQRVTIRKLTLPPIESPPLFQDQPDSESTPSVGTVGGPTNPESTPSVGTVGGPTNPESTPSVGTVGGPTNLESTPSVGTVGGPTNPESTPSVGTVGGPTNLESTPSVGTVGGPHSYAAAANQQQHGTTKANEHGAAAAAVVGREIENAAREALRAAGITDPKRSELLRRFPGLTADMVRKLQRGMSATARGGALVCAIESEAADMIRADVARQARSAAPPQPPEQIDDAAASSDLRLNEAIDALGEAEWASLLQRIEPEIPAACRRGMEQRGARNHPVVRSMVYELLIATPAPVREAWRPGEFVSDMPLGVRAYSSELKGASSAVNGGG